MGFWFWFWVCAFVVVGLLLAFSRFTSLRTWAGRVFGRITPDVSGWGVALKAFGASNWVRGAVVAVVVGGPLLFVVVKYVEARGADKVRIQVERQNTETVARIGQAQTNFERDVRETMEAAVVRELEISEEFSDVERSILEADGREAIAAAHAAGVASLRERAASRHATVVADYVSSLGDGPLPSPAGV